MTFTPQELIQFLKNKASACELHAMELMYTDQHRRKQLLQEAQQFNQCVQLLEEQQGRE
ncbi:MAG: hypothetical protein Q4B80_01865 [Aerococcaceae bacterium]|nr:hypothetical protein [Aerococcaceae bacterium]